MKKNRKEEFQIENQVPKNENRSNQKALPQKKLEKLKNRKGQRERG